MKNFKVYKDLEGYRLYFDDDNLITRTYDTVPSEIEQHVIAIETWCNAQKTEAEIEIEKANQKQAIAFSFIQSTATDEEKLSLFEVFPEYQINHDYVIGDEFQYQGSVFRVLQNHNSQDSWLPTDSPSLYVDIANKITIQEFEQPTGSTDAYQIGDKVLFNGKTYESIINDNVWSPTDYPQGWMEI